MMWTQSIVLCFFNYYFLQILNILLFYLIKLNGCRRCSRLYIYNVFLFCFKGEKKTPRRLEIGNKKINVLEVGLDPK